MVLHQWILTEMAGTGGSPDLRLGVRQRGAGIRKRLGPRRREGVDGMAAEAA